MKQATVVLREAILAAAKNSIALSDRDLLERFARSGDQEAFATLFRRHCGMVLGVCRRSLPTVQDAEDACQATFLILSRKAASGRWQPSIANWLYLTARRVAYNSRVMARRRSRREAKVALPCETDLVERMTARELLDTLENELDKLSPGYREPLVLCYLEGLTRDEAALRLAIPSGTVKIRLERGRKQLAAALAKRGCTAGASLLALAATSPASAPSPRILQTILASTNAFNYPLAPAGRLERNALLQRSVVALLLVAGTIGSAVMLLNPAPTPIVALAAVADPPSAKRIPEPEKSAAATVSGLALRPDGQPLSGAKLFLAGEGARPGMPSTGPPVEIGATGADGSFVVHLPQDRTTARLAVASREFGTDFVELDNVKPGTRIVLHTVRDRPIRGRIVDTEGKPVAGASIVAGSLAIFPGESVDQCLSAWLTKPYRAPALPGNRHLFNDMAAYLKATTDADGHFALHGVGVERLVTLRLSGRGIASAEVIVVNRDKFDPEPYNDAARRKNPPGARGFIEPYLHGPDLTIVAETEKPLGGIITDSETGKPIVGITVLLDWDRNDRLRRFWLTAKSDADGRFTIHGAHKVSAYSLRALSDPIGGYPEQRLSINDTPGYQPLAVSIKLEPGVVISGRIADKRNGQGVYGYVATFPIADSGVPKARNGGPVVPVRESTADDGTFRIVIPPGLVALVASAASRDRVDAGAERYKSAVPDAKYARYFAGYNFGKVLDLHPDTRRVTQEILLEPAREFVVNLERPPGTAGGAVFITGQGLSRTASICYGTTFPIYELDPVKPRRVVCLDDELMLAGTQLWTAGQKQPYSMKLAKTGTIQGRLVDDQGKALSGVQIGVHYLEQEADDMQFDSQLALQNAVSAADGSFELKNILPELECAVTLVRRGRPLSLAAASRSPVKLDIGATKDLGRLTVDLPED